MPRRQGPACERACVSWQPRWTERRTQGKTLGGQKRFREGAQNVAGESTGWGLRPREGDTRLAMGLSMVAPSRGATPAPPGSGAPGPAPALRQEFSFQRVPGATSVGGINYLPDGDELQAQRRSSMKHRSYL